MRIASNGIVRFFEKTTLPFFFLLLLTLLSSACSKLIGDEFPEFVPVPAVNTILVEGEPVTVQVSMAEKIDTTYLTLVDDAEIILSTGMGWSETMAPIGDGLYTSVLIALPGESYECEVSLDGYPELLGRDTVPTMTGVTITGQTNQARYNEEGVFMEGIEFEFRDDPSTDDFYEVVLYRRERWNAWNTYPFNESCDILLNEGLEPYTTETLVFSDLLMEDSLVTMNLDFTPGSWATSCWDGDSCVQNVYEHTLILEFRHVSREYYHYKKHFYLYEKNRYPYFVEGTATAFSLYSNIENGMGVMASYALSIDSIFVEAENIPLY